MDRSRLAASAVIADFEAELLSFPNGRFDDQVDTDRNCSIGCTTISVARRCRVDTTAVGKPVQVRPVRSISAHSNLPAFMYLFASRRGQALGLRQPIALAGLAASIAAGRHSSLDGSTPDQAYFTDLPIRTAA
jgi:hypothetical protein